MSLKSLAQLPKKTTLQTRKFQKLPKNNVPGLTIASSVIASASSICERRSDWIAPETKFSGLSTNCSCLHGTKSAIESFGIALRKRYPIRNNRGSRFPRPQEQGREQPRISHVGGKVT
jgi:hypothetical protein